MLTKLLNYFRTPVTAELPLVEQDYITGRDIHEPVISFVECFKSDPKRFEVIPLMAYTKGTRTYYTHLLTDKLNNKSYTWMNEWEVKNLRPTIFSNNSNHHSLEGIITEAEGLYVRKVLANYYLDRAERLIALKNLRSERESKRKDLLEQQSNAKMREELMEVYCSGKITPDEQAERWMMEGG